MLVKTKRGFTLIEMMVVVVILSVLTLVAVASFQRYQSSARRGEGIELMNDVRIKQEQFFSHYSRYVSSTTDESIFDGTPGAGQTTHMFLWDLDCSDATLASSNAWCLIGFRPKGHQISGDNYLYFQMQTMGWQPGAAAPSFVTNPNSYWLTVQARGLKVEGANCTLLRLTNQVKDALIFDQHPDCP